MKRTLLLLAFMPCVLLAQKGMNFEHGQSWKEIQAKAKAQNKYIFMDAFTTWCGPCKYMAANIFPKEEVGTFFNDKFINVKVQLDTTASDNEEVKKSYADGHAIMQNYKVNVFPTYLFFSPEGKLVHRSVGASEAEAFIAKAADALNPEKQYYVLLDQYKAGKKDPEFLKKLALAGMSAYDMEVAKEASNAFLASGQDLFTKDNLKFINETTTSTSDAGFSIMLKNQQKFDDVFGKGSTNKKLVSFINQQEVFPKIFSKNFNKDWDALGKSITGKYPTQAEETMLTAKVFYYQNTQDWKNFQANIVSYVNKYGANLEDAKLNDIAWTVFENCQDMNIVKEALAWSKRSFEKGNQPEFMDTYSNILYKMGRKKEAIEWEIKALTLAPEGDKDSYKETLEKMTKGEKTWKE